MSSKYQDLLKQAKQEDINHYYQKLLRTILADNSVEDQEFIEKVFLESMHTIVTSDQKKTMKALAKDLVKDKAILKTINEKIKIAPNT
jgi:hypothetical protein